MKPRTPFIPARSLPSRRQRGVALFTIMVFVLLSMLLALWASRSALFSEMVVGNDADYQRAYEAAQALLQDAERDIRGVDVQGQPCYDACPRATSRTAVQFPEEGRELTQSLSLELDYFPNCQSGLCKLNATGGQDFWTDRNTLNAMTRSGVGVTYGEYTGAAPDPSNFILKDRGWYWIEMAQLNPCSTVVQGQECLPVNADPDIVYRITAIAKGRKDASMVVLQQTYVNHKDDDSQ